MKKNEYRIERRGEMKKCLDSPQDGIKNKFLNTMNDDTTAWRCDGG